MKRTLIRAYQLPAFRTDLAGLEALVATLVKEFEPEKPRVYLEVTLPGERLEFGSFDEMRSAPGLPPRLTVLWISIRDRFMSDRAGDDDRDRSCSIRLSASSQANVTAEAQSAAWAAGLIETVKEFAARNKVWYGPLRPWVVVVVSFAFSLLPAVFAFSPLAPDPFLTVRPKFTLGPLALPWALAMITLWALMFRFPRLFPQAVVVVRDEHSWIRRHATELTVLGTLLSALAAIYAAWAGRRKHSSRRLTGRFFAFDHRALQRQAAHRAASCGRLHRGRRGHR